MEEHVSFDCPVCGTTQWLSIDPHGGEEDFHHDCAICCRPLHVRVRPGTDGLPELDVRADD